MRMKLIYSPRGFFRERARQPSECIRSKPVESSNVKELRRHDAGRQTAECLCARVGQHQKQA